jgi:hypothetical protein
MAMVVISIFDVHGHAFSTSMAMVVAIIFDVHGHAFSTSMAMYFRRPWPWWWCPFSTSMAMVVVVVVVMVVVLVGFRMPAGAADAGWRCGGDPSWRAIRPVQHSPVDARWTPVGRTTEELETRWTDGRGFRHPLDGQRGGWTGSWTDR